MYSGLDSTEGGTGKAREINMTEITGWEMNCSQIEPYGTKLEFNFVEPCFLKKIKMYTYLM